MNGIGHIGIGAHFAPGLDHAPAAPGPGGPIGAPPSVSPGVIVQKIQEGLQIVGQQMLTSLSSCISTSKEALTSAINRLIETAPPPPPPLVPFEVTVPPGGDIIEGLEMVQHEFDGEPTAAAQHALQERIQHGYELWRGVTDGTHGAEASMQDVRDLATFFTAKAAAKGQGFRDGAFSIADPGHRLHNFLDSCTEMYQRPSSHINGFQRSSGGHRGIDIHGGVTLPYGKGTVLYGAMNDGDREMIGDRLFFKTENYGCRLSSRFAPNRDPHVQDRPLRFRDVGQFLGHSMGFIKSLLRKFSGGKLFPKSPNARRESIPSDVVRDYKNLIERFENHGPLSLVARLNQDEPMSKAGGIRIMVKNLNQALEHPGLSDEQRAAILQFKYNLLDNFDHLAVRIGNEVVLNPEELSGVKP